MALLRRRGVTLVADVRTTPASRFQPQFSRAAFARALEAQGIDYQYLGDALGGRPRDAARDYQRMAQEPAFSEGLDRLREVASRKTVALVCAERDPMDCHRALLVGRALAHEDAPVAHILFDGAVETQAAFEDRLLRAANFAEGDLLESREARLSRAYRLRGAQISGGRK